MTPDRIGTRILAGALVVAAVALGIVAIGVLRAGADAFAAVMVAAGESADHARAMFDESVAVVLGVAAIVAALGAGVVALLLARRLARPIEDLAKAAGRLADGELSARVPVEGPVELRSLAEAYNTMAERLEEQESVRREFVANASHELRTPLTNLQGYLEALRDGVIAPDAATFESLGEEVDRLSRLAASLDLLAGADGAPAVAGDLDVGALARASAELVAPALARREIELAIVAPDGLIARARADEVVQVLANLLQNAVRYTPDGGRVRVEVAGGSDAVAVRISNSGPGIPAADLPRVWERFYRVEKSRDRTHGGAGIGLAIVKRLVEDAGGRVGVSSADDWTTFWVTLPAVAG
jgi:signal transduction histidine kinase